MQNATTREIRSTPGLYLLLKPDFTIVVVSNAYLVATETKREEIVGCDLKMPRKTGMEVWNGNPSKPLSIACPQLFFRPRRSVTTLNAPIDLGSMVSVKPPSVEARSNLARVIKSLWLEFNHPPLVCLEGMEEAMKLHTAVEIPKTFF